MPSNVAWFEKFMYLDFVISAVISILEDFRLVEAEPDFAIAFLILLAAVLGVGVMLVWLTARRRKNWARWVLLALIVVYDLSFVYDSLSEQMSSDGGVIIALNVVTIVLEIAAFYLIFTGNAREWFRQPIPT